MEIISAYPEITPLLNYKMVANKDQKEFLQFVVNYDRNHKGIFFKETILLFKHVIAGGEYEAGDAIREEMNRARKLFIPPYKRNRKL